MLFRSVLCKPLHHGPTRGGDDEDNKHDDWYRRTLSSYEQFFANRPPRDIWPDPGKRFDRHRFVRVDADRFWFVPRLSLFGQSFRASTKALAPVAVSSGPLLLAAANPLDLSGGEFLQLFLLVSIVVVVVSLGIRFTFGRGGPAGELRLRAVLPHDDVRDRRRDGADRGRYDPP